MIEFSVLLYAREGQSEALAEALLPLVKESQKEDGAIMYDLHASETELYIITEKWLNQEALDRHEATPHFSSFQAAAEKLVDKVVRLPKVVL